MYHPTGEEKVFVVMAEYGVRACFDESGIDNRWGWCVVAGFMGTVAQWSRFEDAWGPYAHEPGFHAKKFFARSKGGHRVKPYRGWTDAQASGYLAELVRAIGDAGVTPVAAGIDLEAFWGYSPEERQALTSALTGEPRFRLTGAPNRPYYLPFLNAIHGAIACQYRKDPSLGVYFSFDEQDVLQSRALLLYRHLKERAKVLDPLLAERMKGITYESDADNIGLQAADLVAYAWFQVFTRREKIHPELREAVETLCRRGGDDEVDCIPRERMEEVLVPWREARRHEDQTD